jgi:hypothetical protein
MTENLHDTFGCRIDLKMISKESLHTAKARLARIEANHSLEQNVDTENTYALLTKLLRPGDKNFNILTDMTDEDIRLCNLLTGPNGYAVYKMLLARREMR